MSWNRRGRALAHTIRNVDGSWQDLRNVNTQEHNNRSLAAAGTSTAADPSELQVAGTTLNGQTWHTIRHNNGSWEATFGDVGGQAGNPGNGRAVACGGIDTELHLVALG